MAEPVPLTKSQIVRRVSERPGRYEPLHLTPARDRRRKWLKASRGLSIQAIFDMGLDAAENRLGDPAEELCLRVSAYLMSQLTREETGAWCRTSIWLRADRDRRQRALKAATGLSLPGIFDLGLDAAETAAGLPVQELRLQVARDLRQRLAEYGVFPYPDPDAEHDRDLEYVLAPKPLRGTAPVLRAGRQPRGVRMRPAGQ